MILFGIVEVIFLNNQLPVLTVDRTLKPHSVVILRTEVVIFLQVYLDGLQGNEVIVLH